MITKKIVKDAVFGFVELKPNLRKAKISTRKTQFFALS